MIIENMARLPGGTVPLDANITAAGALINSPAD
jgi:hypothetical protein